MKLRQRQGESPALVFDEIEPFLLELLRGLPDDADPGDHLAARERLFGAPMQAAEDTEGFNEDWVELIEPEIRDLFRSARGIVVADLEDLPPANGSAGKAVGDDELEFEVTDFTPTPHALTIPASHADAWLTVLNQARLVIAAKRGFAERAMEEDVPMPPPSPRDLDLFKIHFFEFLQQVLLEEMGFG